MLINNTKAPVAFFLCYFLKNPLEDYSIHKKWYFSVSITCWAVSMRYVWRKLDIIHVWTSDKLITVANVNTCLLIESLKEYSNFVIKYSTERDKSGRRRLHEDTMFWVVCSVNNTLTTPLPCVHSSTSLPIHTFQFFSATSTEAKQWNSKINTNSFLLPSLDVRSLAAFYLFWYLATQWSFVISHLWEWVSGWIA